MIIRLTNFFMTLHKNTPANIAKKRLKTIITEYKSNNINVPNYLPQLKQDLIKVICKYAQINSETFSFQFGKKDDDTSILELNVILNEPKTKKSNT